MTNDPHKFPSNTLLPAVTQANPPQSMDEAVLQIEQQTAQEQLQHQLTPQANIDPEFLPAEPLTSSYWHTLDPAPASHPPPITWEPEPTKPPQGPDATPPDPYRGMHEHARQTTPHAYANVTPASFREPHSFPAQKSQVQATQQGENHVMGIIEGSAYQEALEDSRQPQLYAEEKKKESRTGQDSAANGGEAEAPDTPDDSDNPDATPEPPPYETPHWIIKDPGNEMAFFCEHPEAKGRFLAGKPTLTREIAVERAKGRMMGPEITNVGALMAEWFAMLSEGLENAPENFQPGELVDQDLIETLYMELSARWSTFRERFQPPRKV